MLLMMMICNDNLSADDLKSVCGVASKLRKKCMKFFRLSHNKLKRC